MLIYPLSAVEDRAIRWASRIVPALSVAIILLMGAMSVASMPV